VFPQVETWQTQGADIVLVARRRPFVESASALAARLGSEPYRSALASSWRATDVRDFIAHYVGGPMLARTIASTPGAEINTDDRNLVEFGLARAVGKGDGGHVPALRRLARQLGGAHGLVNDPQNVAWEMVDTAWVAYNASDGWSLEAPTSNEAEAARRAALHAYYGKNDLAAASRLWPADAAPRDLVELAMLADLRAEVAAPDAELLIEQVRQYQPTEAAVFLAKLRFRQGRLDEATDILEGVAARLRVDPWPLQRYKSLALHLIERVADTSAPRSARLLHAVEQPFAIRALEDPRLEVAAALALRLADKQTCRASVAALDPHTPWSADYLSLRRDCYRLAGDSRAVAAERDLARFLAAETVPLGIVAQNAATAR